MFAEHIVVRDGDEEIWRGPGEFVVERIGRGSAWRLELSVPPEAGLRFQAVSRVQVDVANGGTAWAAVARVDVRGAAGGALTRIVLQGRGDSPLP